MKRILKFIFNNYLMKFSFYRNTVNKIYQLLKYNENYFLKPEKNILNLHKNNLYLDKVQNRFKHKKFLESDIENFKFDLKNDFSDFFKVDIKKMSSVIGSRFASGNDPLCNTAIQIINNKNELNKDLFLNKYLNNFIPKNYSEVFLIDKINKLNEISQYSFFYPWFHDYPSRVLHNGLFGPKNIDTVEFRSTRLKNIYNLINKFNYIPDEADCIEGYILINDGDYRFIVTSGTHRSSVLNAMNILDLFPDKVPVKFDQMRVENKYFMINKNNVSNWPAVKSGFISEQNAILFFESFFKDKKYL